MMNKFVVLLIFILLFSIPQNSLALKVTGKVALENNSQPSGMEVTFFAVSPTAVTTTVLTLADSTYNADIPAGVYNVIWTKNGYYPYQENSIFFLNDTVLETYQFEYILGAINLDGYVEGTLYKDSFYLVENMMKVAANDTLIIEAGVKIGFKDDAKMEVEGVLFAQGTAEDKILFTTRTYEDEWHSILINSPDSNMILSHCIFENAKYGLGSYSAPALIVEYCDFFTYSKGVDLDTDYLGIVRNCRFNGWSPNGNTSFSGTAIKGKIKIVENNYIEKYGTGIEGSKIAFVQNNRIENCRDGIYTHYGSLVNRLIKNNIINDCQDIGIYIKPRLENTDTVINNTIYQSGTGLQVHSDGIRNLVSMNSISDCDIGIRTNTNTLVSYNLVSKNNHDFYASPQGYGVVIGQNSNGDDIDTYSNVLNKSPLYAVKDPNHSHFLFLRYDSPCVDAGHPDFKDPDGSIRDIGANPYVSWVGVQKETDENLIRLYPNPNSGSFTIELSQISNGRIQVLDLSGRIVNDQTFKSENNISLDLDLQSGIYLLNITSDIGNSTEKFVVR